MEYLNGYVQAIIKDLANTVKTVKGNKEAVLNRLEVEFRILSEIIMYNVGAKIITTSEGQELGKMVCKKQEELEIIAKL